MTGTYNTKIRSLFLAALMVLSVVAGSIALTGAAAAANESINDGGVYFIGQTLVYSNASAGEDYALTKDGEFVREYTADSDGTVTIETSARTAGSYALSGPGLSDPLDFTLTHQDLTAEFGQDDSANDALVVDSGRSGYDVNLSSNDLSEQELKDLFNVTDLTFTVNGNTGYFNYNLSNVNLADGQYDVTVDVTDTNANATATLSVGTGADDAAEFVKPIITEDRGDIAEIEVNLTNVQDAYVKVGSSDVNYEPELKVHDGNGDGTVTILFNTYNTTNSDSSTAFTALNASEGDSVTVLTNASTPKPLAATDYDLVAGTLNSAGDGMATETGVGTLVITESTVSTMGSLTAPASVDISKFETLSDVTDVSTSSSRIAMGDHVALRIGGSGYFGAAGDDFEGFVANNSDASFKIAKVNSGPNADAPANHFGNMTTKIVYDENRKATFVVFDSDSLGTDATQKLGNYRANFTFEGDSVTTSFKVVERTGSFDTETVNGNETVVVKAEQDASISGSTSVAPGTKLRIIAKATGDSPFLLSKSVTVQEDGTFAGSFDFSGASVGTEFTATLKDVSSEDIVAQGIVEPSQSASVSVSDQANDGSYVVVDSVTLSDGGFVTIHDATLNESPFDSVRGTSSYLEAGTHSNVNVSLDTPYQESGEVIAMPHLDTDGDQTYDFVTSEGSDDGPYTADGAAVVDGATLTVEQKETGDNETGDNETGDDETGDDETGDNETGDNETGDDETGDDETGDDTTPEEGPGFGIVAALVALVAAALVALRRD
ncbi:BGTF surface domain-containing protein [Halomarina halobia]|uniref:BGTF surface domain-containing protein n=1 Tax=Halomarina halobia TaxID=3033386 RepID=A0ABD6A5W7_9EURY|nr:BGTF surface domain-containing protein [Halomarina sp. PSR21]